MSTITVRAFAKINLSLRVGAKGADGFHDVRTILQAVDLADRLVCRTKRGPFQIVCSTPGVPTDRTNLVWRAAAALWRAAGRDGEPKDTIVTLEKHIPARAGLGGGSSNAAAALYALRKLWKLRVADEALFALAGRLGSDVPYFFFGGTALALGRGDEVLPLADLPRWPVVLVFPPFGIATADAYQWLDECGTTAGEVAATRYLPGTWLDRIVPLVNDLEPPVIERHPLIGKLIHQLGTLGAALSAMSGSGSTVFGVFTSARSAAKACSALRKAGVSATAVSMKPRR